MKLLFLSIVCVVLSLATLCESIQKTADTSSSNNLNRLRIDDEHLSNGTFITLLDHFRPLDDRKIEFLYHVNSEHYVDGGPLYIYIKDSSESTNRWIEEGLMVDIANETGAALFTFDHRYSGHNRFSGLAIEDLEHLTVEQSLQDIATLVQELRNANAPRSVIVYGSGFGGTLAVWARKKFPHLINAAWSSSGKFFIGFSTYTVYDGLENTFTATEDAECRDLVQLAFIEIKRLLQNDTNDVDTLQQLFDLCGPVDTDSLQEINAFYETLYNLLISYFNHYDANAVGEACRSMRALPDNPLGSFARWLNFVIPRPQCFDPSYASLIQHNLEDSDSDSRQWLYLQCSQMAVFLTGDESSWLPALPLSYHIEKCEDLFGDDFSEVALHNSVAAMTTSYGTLEPHITSVIYTNGGIDPWKYNGILSTNVWDSFAFHLDHQGRSADLRSISNSDMAQTMSVKQKIREIIVRWSTNPVD